MARARDPRMLLQLATSWLVCVAERSRLDLTEHTAQDGMLAVAVGHRNQELWPLVRSHVDFELPAKDAAAPRVVQSGRYRPTALGQASILSAGTSTPASVLHWSNVTGADAAPVEGPAAPQKAGDIGAGVTPPDGFPEEEEQQEEDADDVQTEESKGGGLQEDEDQEQQDATTQTHADDLMAERTVPMKPDDLPASKVTPPSERGGLLVDSMALSKGKGESLAPLGFGGRSSHSEESQSVHPLAAAAFNLQATPAVKKGAALLRAEALAEAGPEEVVQAMGQLKAWLMLADADVREKAAQAIGKGGEEAVLQAMRELKSSLKDAQAKVRRKALWAVGMGGPQAVLQVVGELKISLQDKEDSEIREEAAYAIGRGGREAVLQAMGELMTPLQDEHRMCQFFAAWAISRAGPEAVLKAVSKLKEVAPTDVNDNTIRHAALQLRRVRPVAIREAGQDAVLQSVGELRASLEDPDDDKTRRMAAWAIGTGGEGAVLQAIGELKAALNCTNWNVRQKAAWAIGMGGPKAVRQAIGELKASAQNEENAEVLEDVARSIGLGGSEAVHDAKDELEHLLLLQGDQLPPQPTDASIHNARKAAGISLRSGGEDVISSAVAHVRPLLGESKNHVDTRVLATEAIGMLGPRAIEDNFRALLWMLRRRSWGSESWNETKTLAAEAESAARVLREYIDSGPNSVPFEMFDALKMAQATIWKFRRQAEPEIQATIEALERFTEDNCMANFKAQVDKTVLVKRWRVETPKGHMVMTDSELADHGLQAHRCPNIGACPGEVLNVIRANFSCPLARKDGEGAPCSDGYDGNVAGCAACLRGWGRSLKDPFVCQTCGYVWKQWARWLAHPSVLLAISMWSARRAAAPGDAAAFANDVLKIFLSFSSTAAVIISSLATSDAYHRLTAQAKGWLESFSGLTQSGESVSSMSPDCLWGRSLSLNELLALSLANPAVVLFTATLMLGFIYIVRRWQSNAEEDSGFTKDMMTLGLVSGNLYLPGIAAACAIALPCYHTQNEDVSKQFRMVYSLSDGCDQRLFYMALRAPFLALVFVVGPALWLWLLNRHHEDKEENRYQVLRFLTASYHRGNKGWEANRLAKNMLVKCAVAVAPMSYCPGLQLTLVLCIMFSFTAMHLRTRPYKFDLLNKVEAISLWVLNICMVVSSLVVSGSWYLTRIFALLLFSIAYGLMTINTIGLALLFLWAKFKLRDDDPVLQDVAIALTGHTETDQN